MEQGTKAEGALPISNEEALALIRKIENGEKPSLIILYDRTSRLLFGLVLRILGDRALAEETLLDVYTYIWKQSASYNPRIPALEWLMAIARARAVAMLHWTKPDKARLQRRSGIQDLTMTVAPEQQILSRASIEALIPTQREILEWIYFSGLSCSEIAAQVGKPLGVIKTHARLGLIKLSEQKP